MKNPNLTMLILDFLTKLVCAAGIGLEACASPCSFLVENFARIGRAEFSITPSDEFEASRLLREALRQNMDIFSTAIFYWARCIRIDAGNSNRLAALLLANLCNPGLLGEAINTINSRTAGLNNTVTIDPRRSPALWLFLKSIIVQRQGSTTLRIMLDINYLIRWSKEISKLNLPDEIMAGIVQAFRSSAFVTIDELSEAANVAGLRESEVATIRRFVNNPDFIQRIRPY